MFVDLSHSLNENTQIYPGDPSFSCCPSQTLAKDGFNVLQISMGSHTGTHVDAPYHVIADGKTIDDLPLTAFIGNAVVIPLVEKGPRERIVWADLEAYENAIRQKALLPDGVCVLLYTGWSRFWRTDKYFGHPFLDSDAATKLLALGAKLIGIDTLSPDETRMDEIAPDFGVHTAVLGAGKVIAENLTNLEEIKNGEWLVNVVPLKLSGSDGSPVRAFATPATHSTSV